MAQAQREELEEAETSEEKADASLVNEISKETQLELILETSNKTVNELYNLSSTALAVDQQIEQKTWRFTREELKIYLEAMGCDYTEGKGSHIKVPLPKAMSFLQVSTATHVMQGPILITVWNDFGGALTLPPWDKDYVPHYLRRQILEARKKLHALAIKAMQESEKTLSS